MKVGMRQCLVVKPFTSTLYLLISQPILGIYMHNDDIVYLLNVIKKKSLNKQFFCVSIVYFSLLSVSAVNLFSVYGSCEAVVQLFRRRAGKNKTPNNAKSVRDIPFLFGFLKCVERTRLWRIKH